MYNFQFILSDTDSVMFCKPDGSEFSQEEIDRLVGEINSRLAEQLNFECKGQYKRVLIAKAKNYALYDPTAPENEKLEIKGSGLKATTKEKNLRDIIKFIVESFLYIDDEQERIATILEKYHKTVDEIMNIQDISGWCSKKTITSKVLNPERSNELNILNAIGNKPVQEGDKIYVFYKNDKELALGENFKGEYSKTKLLEKLYKTVKIFEKVLDISLFPNYSLKRNFTKLTSAGTNELISNC